MARKSEESVVVILSSTAALAAATVDQCRSFASFGHGAEDHRMADKKMKR